MYVILNGQFLAFRNIPLVTHSLFANLGNRLRVVGGDKDASLKWCVVARLLHLKPHLRPRHVLVHGMEGRLRAHLVGPSNLQTDHRSYNKENLVLKKVIL